VLVSALVSPLPLLLPLALVDDDDDVSTKFFTTSERDADDEVLLLSTNVMFSAAAVTTASNAASSWVVGKEFSTVWLAGTVASRATATATERLARCVGCKVGAEG